MDAESIFFNDMHILSLRSRPNICEAEQASGGIGGKAAVEENDISFQDQGISAVAGTTFTWSTPILAPGPQPCPRCQSACWWVSKQAVSKMCSSGTDDQRSDICGASDLCRQGYLVVYGGACHTSGSNQTSEYGDRVHDLEDCWLFGFQVYFCSFLRLNSGTSGFIG